MEDGRVLRVVGEVGEFVGVGIVVVEFEAIFAFVPFGAAPAGSADGAAPEFGIRTTAGLGEGSVVNFGYRVIQDWTKALAL